MFLKTTKKLFKKTIDSVKYFFSSTGYQKIPKIPPKIITKEDEQVREKGTNYGVVIGNHVTQECYRLKPELEVRGGSRREGRRSCLVAQKLEELKTLENYEDLEQVIFYYSRLTCPAYVEIVDKFFMEMYSELFNNNAS